MNIIILSDKLSAPMRLAFSGRQAVVLGSIALVTVIAMAALTFLGGHVAGMSRNAAAGEIEALRAELAQYESGLADVRQSSQRDLNALALRLGELKAEATRLNALGERLTVAGRLEEGEFDFSTPPAVGGPQTLSELSGIDPDSFLKSLGDLERQFAHQSEQLSVIEQFLLGRDVERSLMPSGWPVDQGYISSHYGYRTDPFSGGRDLHLGIDFNGDRGDPVYAVADGVVSFSGMHFGYGNMVEIDHGNGYKTRYAHHNRNLVEVGAVLKAGQQIGEMGSTGRSTGVHLHFEVWHNERPVNPLTFVKTVREERPAS
jgi:murein DD-endopeptidase MepM/ murein hydrolase activator NlpD